MAPKLWRTGESVPLSSPLEARTSGATGREDRVAPSTMTLRSRWDTRKDALCLSWKLGWELGSGVVGCSTGVGSGMEGDAVYSPWGQGWA